MINGQKQSSTRHARWSRRNRAPNSVEADAARQHRPMRYDVAWAAPLTRKAVGVSSTTMGRVNGPYNADFPEGTRVRIADRTALGAFRTTWKLHDALRPEQL